MGYVVPQVHDAFGRPVEPDEYIQNAMSSRCMSAASRNQVHRGGGVLAQELRHVVGEDHTEPPGRVLGFCSTRRT
jgi:hypothetical protein